VNILKDKIECPACHTKVILPWLPEIRHRKLQDDYDMAERDAQEILNDLWNWLSYASLWSFVKFWWRGGKK